MATSKFGNIGKRAASGAVFVAFTIGCVWFGSYSFLSAFGIFMVGALFEFYKLGNLKNSPQYVIGILMGLGLYVLNGLALLQILDFKYLLFLILPLLFSVVVATFSTSVDAYAEFGKMLGGLAYASFPFVAVQYVGLTPDTGDYDSYHVILFMVLVWSNDTFAYLTGKFLGRNPLAKSISPGKTWEGTVGGFIGSLLMAVAASQLFPDKHLADTLTVWFAASVLAVVGDLSESKLKRSVNVKNSGNFMPGHGGFLDRFDSLLLSAPFLMVYFLLVKA